MAKLELKYVNQSKGNYYFRRKGCKRVKLPGRPGSPEFMDAYQLALSGAEEVKIEAGADKVKPGTVRAAVARFKKSERFTKNKEVSQAGDANILEALCVDHGEKRIGLLQEKHVKAAIEAKAGKPGAQRNWRRVLRVFCEFCVEDGLMKTNPALCLKPINYKTSGYHSWTEEELEQFEKRHPVGTKARLAFALILWTGQRRGDTAQQLGPQCIVMRKGEKRLVFTQSKRDRAMDIPLAPPLEEIINATPTVGLKTFLVTKWGKPYSPAGFGNWFREQCDEAGLHHCSAHGMRKAFLRRGAELGWSEDYLASFSGHTDMRELRTYVEAANRARMAGKAMESMVAEHAKEK
jgi:integrase